MTTTSSTELDPAPLRRLDRPDLRALPGGAAEQLCLPYEYDVAPGIPAEPPAPTHLHLVGDPGPALDPHLPDPGRWTFKIARAIAEVAIGARPPGQLTTHVERGVLATLARRGQAAARHPSSVAQRGVSRLRTVRGIRVCPVADGIVECSAVLIGGDRAQAIALRFEAVDGRWLATAVQLG